MVIISSHIVAILPMVLVEVNAIPAPSVNIQLHNSALIKVVIVPSRPSFAYSIVLVSAIVMVSCGAGIVNGSIDPILIATTQYR